jgi:hypothetical protein
MPEATSGAVLRNALSIFNFAVEPVPIASLAWTPKIHLRLARPRTLSLRHGQSRGRIAGIPLLSTARTLRRKRMAIAHDGTL